MDPSAFTATESISILTLILGLISLAPLLIVGSLYVWLRKSGIRRSTLQRMHILYLSIVMFALIIFVITEISTKIYKDEYRYNENLFDNNGFLQSVVYSSLFMLSISIAVAFLYTSWHSVRQYRRMAKQSKADLVPQLITAVLVLSIFVLGFITIHFVPLFLVHLFLVVYGIKKVHGGAPSNKKSKK